MLSLRAALAALPLVALGCTAEAGDDLAPELGTSSAHDSGTPPRCPHRGHFSEMRRAHFVGRVVNVA
jgi:hypothetical protein